MGGGWIFKFNYENKDSFHLAKYQDLLRKLRCEFESEFSIMDSTEGSVYWTDLTACNVPADNIFATFSYRCTKEHVFKGVGHGIWKLFWDPTVKNPRNDIHARCAPILFKDLSNQIQMKLAEKFPDHFTVLWKSGLSGYDGSGPGGSWLNQHYETVMNDVLTKMMGSMAWNDSSNSHDSDDCVHHIPWEHCFDCSDAILEMHG